MIISINKIVCISKVGTTPLKPQKLLHTTPKYAEKQQFYSHNNFSDKNTTARHDRYFLSLFSDVSMCMTAEGRNTWGRGAMLNQNKMCITRQTRPQHYLSRISGRSTSSTFVFSYETSSAGDEFALRAANRNLFADCFRRKLPLNGKQKHANIKATADQLVEAENPYFNRGS